MMFIDVFYGEFFHPGTFAEEVRRAFLGGGPQLLSTEFIHSSLERYRLQTIAAGQVKNFCFCAVGGRNLFLSCYHDRSLLIETWKFKFDVFVYSMCLEQRDVLKGQGI